jgi:hypothetical protein
MITEVTTISCFVPNHLRLLLARWPVKTYDAVLKTKSQVNPPLYLSAPTLAVQTSTNKVRTKVISGFIFWGSSLLTKKR